MIEDSEGRELIVLESDTRRREVEVEGREVNLGRKNSIPTTGQRKCLLESGRHTRKNLNENIIEKEEGTPEHSTT